MSKCLVSSNPYKPDPTKHPPQKKIQNQIPTILTILIRARPLQTTDPKIPKQSFHKTQTYQLAEKPIRNNNIQTDPDRDLLTYIKPASMILAAIVAGSKQRRQY
jgi:hypothetical protein